MNSSVRQSGVRNLRRNATPEISQVTRAVRIALAASATVVALALPATVLAASNGCTTAASLAHCQDARGLEALAAVDDPSQVMGGPLPAAVHAGFEAFVANAYDSGIVVTDPYVAVLENSDAISAFAHADGDAQAYGGVAGSGGFSYLTNTADGSIDAVAVSEAGSALAVGAYAYAGDVATLLNYGDVAASATSMDGNAQAYAAVVAGVPAGIGLLINGGSLQAHASTGDGLAQATGAYVVANVATIFNDAEIDVSASSGANGTAIARGAAAYGRYAAIYSYGDVTVGASGGLSASATGIGVQGYYGASAYNAGTIEVAATADGLANATGSSAIASIFGAYSTNVGSIDVAADGASAEATGLLNASLYLGDAITINEGRIQAVANGGIAAYGETEAIAIGAYNFSAIYGSLLYNGGSISATALATADISGTYGFLQAKALGAEAINVYGYGDTLIANTGDIEAVAVTSQGYASAWAVVAQTTGLYGGTVLLDNDGMIDARAYSDVGVSSAVGAYAINQVGDITAINHGDISATARTERGIAGVSVNYAYATGLKESSYYGTVGIANYGNISAIASGEGAITGARGIQASGANVSIANAAGAHITSIGEVDLFGGGFATGIEASGIYSIDIVNDGDIDVYGHAHAFSEGDHGYYGAARALGIYAAAGFQGNVSVANNGSITATAVADDSLSWAQGGAGATGINAYAKYDASIVNNGDIAAIAQTQFGNSGAYGVIGHGKYSTSVVNTAGSTILAESSTGTQVGDLYGGRTVSFGVHVFGNGMEQGVVYNAGSIVSHATATAEEAVPNATIASAWGASIGAYSNVGAGTIINLGDIEAAASADFGYATAYGSYVATRTSAATSNEGTISASADATNGNAWSVGSFARAVDQRYYVPCEIVDGPYGPYNSCDYGNAYWVTTGGDAALDNLGDIASVARAAGGIGQGYGAAMLGGFYASISNSGQITAVTEADDALAVGALANAFYGQASVDNSGVIGAVARGDIAEARGVHVLGLTGTQVDNSGTIVASAFGADATATAVAMESNGSNVLNNSGTIAAFGDGERIAIDASAGGNAWLSNAGTLVGAVVTGDGDDLLDNAAGGSWLAIGSSDFGGGDDAIVNHGTIVMQDAAIGLGAFATGNAFDNFGTLAVSGNGSIDMGGAFAFQNAGTISFIDGVADDVLTIVGGFGGSGTLNIDADLSTGIGDHLVVQGNVGGSAMQTVNANVFGTPVQALQRIAVASASGSLAGHFALGTVHYDATDFLAQDFSLSQSAQTVWLESAVTGLDDGGSLAATAANAAAGMLDAQIGTFRQRMGVIPHGDDGKVLSAFLRTYTSEGDVDPTHVATNFGQGGNFAYDQSTWGRELGINANLFGNWHAGLTLGSADSRQRLTGNGVGASRMDGMTWGVYATWLDPQGVYVDLSGRWMAVDIASTSVAGQRQARAHTGAWNVEAGYQWTVGGLSVVPQLQYTRTKVGDISAFRGQRASLEGDGGTSTRGRLGVEVSKTFTSGNVRWTPYGSINAIREFDGEMTYTVADNFFGSTGTKGSSAMAELGLGLQSGGWGFTLGASWTDGGAIKRNLSGQAIVRFAW